MFERLDPAARRAIDVGIAESRRFGHGWLGTEHVLIGLLVERAQLPEQAQALLPTADAVRQRLGSGLRSDGSQVSDAALLASLGIDMAEVRRRAAETFGNDAVQRAALRARTGPGLRRRRRCERPPRCVTTLAGESLGMAPRLKRAFEAARRQCDQRGETAITPRVLLDALLRIEDGLACEMLMLMGVDVARVRAVLGS